MSTVPDISVLTERASMLSSAGSYRDAFQLYSTVLSVQQQTYGDPSPQADEVKMTLADVAHAISIQENGEEARDPRRVMPKGDAISKFDAKTLLLLTENMLSPANTTAETRRTVRYRQTRGSVLAALGVVLYHQSRTRAAAQALEKAVGLLASVPDSGVEGLATVLLSLAAALNRLGKHREALQRAQEALEMVLRVGNDEHGALLASCYYNVGVEQEHLCLRALSLRSYRTAFELAYMSLGLDHPFTQRIKTCHTDQQARVADEARIEREAERKRVYAHHVRAHDRSVGNAAMAFVDLNASHRQKVRQLAQEKREMALERSYLQLR